MKHNMQTKTRQWVTAAMIAAAYTAISLVLMPISFGAVQVRLSEALTLLTVFSPVAIWGVTLGCAITNAIGVATGAVLLPDVFIGTAATLIAAIMSYRLREVRFKGLAVASSLPPVLVNAVIIGAELTFMYTPTQPGLFWLNALLVGAGQVASCCVAGILLVAALEKHGVQNHLFGKL